MNKDDIIRMAREAECSETWGGDAFKFTVEELERFAALVAEAEREACAKAIEPTDEHRKDAWGYIGGVEGVDLLDNAAQAIRARGTT